MVDFNNLLDSEKEFWLIDDSLKSHLIDINKNLQIQTLYSKLGLKNVNRDKTSYLEFAFSKNLELKLLREVIPELIYNYNTENISVCTYDYSLPKKNPNFKEDSEKFGMGCTDDFDYFMINSIKINLNSHNKQTHKDFWIDIKNELSQLG